LAQAWWWLPRAWNRAWSPIALTPEEIQRTSQGALSAPGMQQLNLVGDPAKPVPYTLRLKFLKGLRIAPHAHPDSREVTVLSGLFATESLHIFDSNTRRAV